METQTYQQLQKKLDELIDSFKNLKDYCLFNNITLYSKCENLYQEAKLIKDQIENKENPSLQILNEKIEALTQTLNKLKKEFV